jgi:hypothetical protein
VELLAYAAFFLFILVSAVGVFLFLQSQETSRAQNAYAQEIAYGFSDSIGVAFTAGPGFYQKVALPPSLLGSNYALAVSKNPNAASFRTGLVYVYWNSSGKPSSFSAPTATASYIFQSVPGQIWGDGELIFISPSAGNLNMSNSNGSISIRKWVT